MSWERAPSAFRLVAVAVLTLVLSLQAGCTNDAGAHSRAEILRLSVPESRPSLQPTGFLGYSIASYGIGEQLVRPRSDGSMVPWLLESFNRTNPTTWSLRLRPGIRFHNGAAVDAAAVVAALERQAKDSFRTDALTTGKLRATGPLEITLTTPTPTATVPEDLGGVYRYYVVYDVAAADRAGRDEGKLVDAGIYTGPFRPTANDGRRITATRFDGYWGQAPPWSGLEIIPMPDPQARLSAVRSGEADVALAPPAEAAVMVEGDHRLEYRAADLPNHAVYAQFNAARPPFDDEVVRRAFVLGIDYQRLARDVAGGRVYTPARGLYPDGLPFTVYTQRTDTGAAAAILDGAGWRPGPDGVRVRNGQRLRVTYLHESSRPEHESVGLSLHDQLRPLGFDVALTPVEDAYDNESWPAEWSITAVSLTLDGNAPAEVIGGWLSHDGLNFGKISDARLDRLVDDLRRTDPPQRHQLLRDVQRLVADRAYATVLAFRPTDVVVRSGFDTFRPDEQFLFFTPTSPAGG
ncbi:ABC transporter substrate-binding protein [Actinomycetes bacterium KLBMP 9797]